MSAPVIFLVLTRGPIRSRISVLKFDGQRLHLTSSSKTLTCSTLKGMLGNLRNFFEELNAYEEEFAKVLIIGQVPPHSLESNQIFILEDEAYSRSLRFFSANSEILMAHLAFGRIIWGEGSYGRVNVKKGKYYSGMPLKIAEFMGNDFGAKVARWLPYEMPITEIENYLAQKVFYPAILPQTESTQYLDASYGRELLRAFAPGSFRWGKERLKEVVLVGDLFTNISHPGEAVLSFLDGVELEGAFHVFWDPQQIFPVVGALTRLEKEVFTRSLLREFIMTNLVSLGTVVVFSHEKKWGSSIARVILELGLDEPLRIDVNSGEIVRVPFEAGREGSITLHLRRGVRVESKDSPRLTIFGGKLGVVLDGRGRPLPLPKINYEDKEKIKNWRKVLVS